MMRSCSNLPRLSNGLQTEKLPRHHHRQHHHNNSHPRDQFGFPHHSTSATNRRSMKTILRPSESSATPIPCFSTEQLASVITTTSSSLSNLNPVHQQTQDPLPLPLPPSSTFPLPNQARSGSFQRIAVLGAKSINGNGNGNGNGLVSGKAHGHNRSHSHNNIIGGPFIRQSRLQSYNPYGHPSHRFFTASPTPSSSGGEGETSDDGMLLLRTARSRSRDQAKHTAKTDGGRRRRSTIGSSIAPVSVSASSTAAGKEQIANKTSDNVPALERETNIGRSSLGWKTTTSPLTPSTPPNENPENANANPNGEKGHSTMADALKMVSPTSSSSSAKSGHGQKRDSETSQTVEATPYTTTMDEQQQTPTKPAPDQSSLQLETAPMRTLDEAGSQLQDISVTSDVNDDVLLSLSPESIKNTFSPTTAAFKHESTSSESFNPSVSITDNQPASIESGKKDIEAPAPSNPNRASLTVPNSSTNPSTPPENRRESNTPNRAIPDSPSRLSSRYSSTSTPNNNIGDDSQSPPSATSLHSHSSHYDHLSSHRQAPMSPNGSPRNSAFIFASGPSSTRQGNQHRRLSSVTVGNKKPDMSGSTSKSASTPTTTATTPDMSGTVSAPDSGTGLGQVQDKPTSSSNVGLGLLPEGGDTPFKIVPSESSQSLSDPAKSPSNESATSEVAESSVAPPAPKINRQRLQVVIRDFAFPRDDDRFRGRRRVVSQAFTSSSEGEDSLEGGPGGGSSSGGFMKNIFGNHGRRKSSFGNWGEFSLGGFGWGNLRGKNQDANQSAASSPDVLIPPIVDLTPSSSIEPTRYILSGPVDDDGPDEEETGFYGQGQDYAGSQQQFEEPAEGLHRVLYSFVSEGTHEMSVVQGEIVNVKGRLEAGWVIAERTKTEEDESAIEEEEDEEEGPVTEGLVPESYLELIRDYSQEMTD